MRNKRGFMFGFVLVFVTLFLSASVILLYGVQQRNSDNSLVSPSSVLEMRDNLTLFEMREVELIKDAFESTSGEFGGGNYKKSLRSSFIDKVMANEKMKSFLFADLYVDNVEIRDEDKNRNLLERIYPEILGDKDGINFDRTKVEKRSSLVASDESKIEFPVYFTFEFEQKYLIDENGEVVKG